MKTFSHRIILLCLSLLFLHSTAFGQSNNYAKVKVELSSAQAAERLHQLGLDIDHFQSAGESAIKFVINREELPLLDQAGLPYTVIIPDMQAHYQRQAEADRLLLPTVSRGGRTADRFGYGSMGGFYTLAELEAKLDEMSEDFPNLATEKFSIGTSIEGRDIWAIKISDNPNIDEDEDVVYYDALHHAREPLSMATTINYAFWLLENYEENPQIKYIIDNRELYFVPCVNPDGYEYNREISPDGGGLWRKNRRPVDAVCFGVDLNRNYSEGFGINNFCSSLNACSNTYRGTEPFSEPESQAVVRFVTEIAPKVAFSTHSTAGSCLMPFGYSPDPADFSIYSEWASDFLSENDYPYGTTSQMLGYTSCGTTRDFLHTTGIYAWTPEIDGSGFWPAQSEIFDLVDENIYPFFYQAWIAGQYTDLQSHEVTGDVEAGQDFQLTVEVKNKGLGQAVSDVEVLVVPNDPLVSVSGDGRLGRVGARSRATTAPFSLSVDPSFSTDSLLLMIIVQQDEVGVDSQQIVIPTGTKTVLFVDDAENGISKWSSEGDGLPWGLNADDSYDGDFSFGDSFDGNSLNNSQNSFTLNESIDLSGVEAPWLEFYSKWSLERGDIVTLQIQLDNNNSWFDLKTFEGSEPWHQELIDLSLYAVDLPLGIRFRLSTDNSIPSDGFYFDKISVSDYRCCSTSTEEPQAVGFTLSPNPFDHSLRIAAPDAAPFRIELFDINGQQLRLLEATGSVEMNLQNLRPGTYVVRLTDQKRGVVTVKKVLKI
ncbi:MAG: M14 family zinc carboxypeptidase [Bacteroidota bacterium]